MPSESQPPFAVPTRLMSLDALRGFDMLWILGADELGHAMNHLERGPIFKGLAVHLSHAPWEGFRFYDLIFPLFVFMIGVAITFSLRRLVETDGRRGALGRIFRRALFLYVLGVFYYGGLSTPLEGMRFVGVLQRLALCYFFAGLCYIYLRPRGIIVVGLVLLLGYWALLTLVNVPGFGAGDFAEGHNLSDWVDKMWLPGRKWNGNHDPEGLLSTLPAIASCLLGVLAGVWLRDETRSGRRRALGLALAGVALVAAGWIWGFYFPVIKRIWTSSYVLVAGGWSALLLALFYDLIDVQQKRTWAMPLVWVGSNALAIYLIGNIVDFTRLSARFAGGSIAAWLDSLRPGMSEMVLALIGTGLCIALCRFLYQRKIFLRL